jgi:hypothetical protein
MSTFRVKLNNTYRGGLDVFGGVELEPSIQRSIYVQGPRGIRRQLKDGDVFTDCNYWKQFAYPQMSEQDAFIEVVSDDGSVYSTIQEENNFPRVYTLSVEDGSSFEDNVVDVYGDNGGAAGFVQINNFASSGPVRVRMNNISNAVFDLEQGSIQQFNLGDVSISKLEFSNESGTNSTVQIILSVLNIPKS